MKLLYTAVFISLVQLSFAQSNETTHIFDQDWKPTKEKKGVFLIRVRQLDNGGYEKVFYKMYGPRLRKETFSDEKGTIRNGKCAYYRADGTIDSAGQYANDKMNGTWYYFNHKGYTRKTKMYQMGALVHDTTFNDRNDDKDTPLKPGEKESAFPGGDQGWIHYLQKNLQYPDRAVSAEVMGDVKVQFIVDKEGNVREPEISKSVELSLDDESLRIIEECGKWEPAVQDGRVVKSYKIQPIQFRLTTK